MNVTICDRCGAVIKEPGHYKIKHKLIGCLDDEVLDLCDDCSKRLKLFLENPESEVCVPITTAMLSDEGLIVRDGYGVVIPNESA